MKRKHRLYVPWLDPRGRRLKDIPHRAVYATPKGYRPWRGMEYDLLCCDDKGVAVGGWIVHKGVL